MIHPVRQMFQQLTERGMSQLHVHDADTIEYITNLLTEFVHVENMYRIKDDSGQSLEYACDILERASREPSDAVRREYYRHLGDLVLFNLGLFPESLTRGRHTVSPSYYAQQGRRSYNIVADIPVAEGSPEVFRKLSDQFEYCVRGLNWVKVYINDPFYQYMLREFDVT
jgi:hypothetical protein